MIADTHQNEPEQASCAPATGSAPTPAQLEKCRRDFRLAAANAKKVLKAGDRLRVTKCPGTKRVITFAGWDGDWIVSKSGINDYAASCVDMVNGERVDFCAQNDAKLCNSPGSGASPKPTTL